MDNTADFWMEELDTYPAELSTLIYKMIGLASCEACALIVETNYMEYRFCTRNGEKYAEMICLDCHELDFESYDDSGRNEDDNGGNEDDPCGCRECAWRVEPNKHNTIFDDGFF